MTRRVVVGIVVAVSAIGGWGWWWTTSRAPVADLVVVRRQNVLLITVDTLRADALGVAGGPAATPAIDALARDGVWFDFAHAHAVLTLPSHTSLLSGLYPFQHGVRENSGYRVSPQTHTIATLLKSAGYATGAFVSGFPLDARFGLNVGFDRYDDQFGGGRESEFRMSERPASVVVPLAREWVAAQAARASTPWFAWLHAFDPHAPYTPPPPFDTQFAGRPYYGEVSAVDASLGPLFDELRRSAQSTLVVLTADHGEGLGEHGEESHGIFAYESTLRVPLILAELGGGRRSGAVGERSGVGARHIDILPTILEAVGQPVPADLPGRSLLPAAERRPTATPRPTYFEAMSGLLSHGWAPLTGVISGADKFISLPLAERYALASDAGERVNLAGQDAARDRVLIDLLSTYRAALPGAPGQESAEALSRLGALGYTSSAAPRKVAFTEADDPKRLIDLDATIHRALDAFLAGRLVEAEDLYKKVIDRRPDMAIAYRHIAAIEWQAGNGAAAIAVLRVGASRAPLDPRVRTQLGEYLSDSGDAAAALQVLEPMARGEQPDAEALTVFGIALARAGRSAEAQRAFERLSTILPTSSVPYENLGVLALARRDLSAAARAFDRAVSIAPGSSRAHHGRGVVAFERGDRAVAYAEWRQAIALDATNVDAVFSLGMNLARDGRDGDARPLLEQFLRDAPMGSFAAQRRDAERWLRR